jgi:hypothetical protein
MTDLLRGEPDFLLYRTEDGGARVRGFIPPEEDAA